MKRIIYTRKRDGGVSVVTPNINIDEPITEEEALQRAFDKLPSSAINPQIVEANTISSDRTFRNAWEKDEKVIKTNMTKAKDMTKDRLRDERKPLLEAQDVAFQRALEESKDTSAIVKEKNRLRDITNQVDGMKTLDELKGASI